MKKTFSVLPPAIFLTTLSLVFSSGLVNAQSLTCIMNKKVLWIPGEANSLGPSTTTVMSLFEQFKSPPSIAEGVLIYPDIGPTSTGEFDFSVTDTFSNFSLSTSVKQVGEDAFVGLEGDIYLTLNRGYCLLNDTYIYGCTDWYFYQKGSDNTFQLKLTCERFGYGY